MAGNTPSSGQEGVEKPREGFATDAFQKMRQSLAFEVTTKAQKNLDEEFAKLVQTVEYKEGEEGAFQKAISEHLTKAIAANPELQKALEGKNQREIVEKFAEEYTKKMKENAEKGKDVTSVELDAFLETGPGKVVKFMYKDEPAKIEATYKGETFMGMVLGFLGIGLGKSFLDGFDKDSWAGQLIAKVRDYFRGAFDKYAGKMGIKLEGMKAVDALQKLKAGELAAKEIRLAEAMQFPAGKCTIGIFIPGERINLGGNWYESGRTYRNVSFVAAKENEIILPAGSLLKNTKLETPATPTATP